MFNFFEWLAVYNLTYILDDSTLRNMVVWLEDQQIRHYKVEERDKLRNVKSPDWPNAYSQYLEDLGISVDGLNPTEIVDSLLTVAIRLEYGDNGMCICKYAYRGFSKA